MVVKKILFLFFYFFRKPTQMFYKNENFVVTDIDLEIYIKLNKDNYGIEINSNEH